MTSKSKVVVVNGIPYTGSDAVEQTIQQNPPTNSLGFQLESAKRTTDAKKRPPRSPKTTRSAAVTSFASNTVEGPASIVELARALNVDNNGPQLMYEWVYNNVEWEPGWGISKGDVGAIHDGMGTQFDQAQLLASLLRQAGFTANIVMGSIRLTEAQYMAWWNVTDIWGAQAYCLNEFIPIVTAPTWTGTEWYMDIKHVWVEWVSSSTYIFDPSYKQYSRKTGLSSGALASALGYNASTFMTNAQSGSTVTTDYAQKINRGNIRSDLTTLSGNLASYLKTNAIGSAPAGTATIDDVLGGQTIVPATIPLLQTSLPYQKPSDSPTTWTGNVPSTFKPTLRVQFPNWSTPGVWDIDETFESDELAGKRLTLWYSGSLVPSLYLDGTVVATGLAQGSGTYTSIYLTVDHPAYDAANYPLSFQQFYQTNWQWWQSFIYAGSSYLIGSAWGNLGRGQMDHHANLLAANSAAGGSSTSEPVLGEKLAVTFYRWAAQNSRIADLVNRLKNCHTMYNHQVGVVSFYNGQSTGIDLGGVVGSSSNLANDTTQTPINDTALAMHGVALEAATLQQMIGTRGSASTTTVIDEALRTVRGTMGGTVTAGNVMSITVTDSALPGGTQTVNYTVVGGDTLTTIAAGISASVNSNSNLSVAGITAKSSGTIFSLFSQSQNTTTYSASVGGGTETISLAYDKIYKGTSSNWNTGTNVQNILVANGYNSGDMTDLYNWYISGGWSILLGNYPSVDILNWSGWGYWAYPTAGAYGIINGAFKGSDKDGEPDKLNKQDEDDEEMIDDPISVFTGAFGFDTKDLDVGSQSYPYRLSFGRNYNSKRQYSAGVLGRGWKHNHDVTATVSSNGFFAMGEQYALPACATIASLYVSVDLISDTARPVAKLVTITVSDAWWIDQIVNNAVVFAEPSVNQIFIKQPDGSFSPPVNFPNTLALVSGLYRMTTPQGVQTNFNAAGQISSVVFPNGVTVSYTYTSGLLTSISNGMGRTLTLSYTSGKLTSVSDGTGRSVSFTVDGSGNLSQFTDANGKNYTYSYDQPGRMTAYFNPAFPSTAFATNVYDSLSRVKTQANARNQVTSYYLAGSRAHAVDPVGNKRTWYLNPLGSTIKHIDGLGNATTTVYDGLNRPIEVIQPEGNKVVTTFDKNDNPLTVTAVAKSGSGLSNIVQTMTYDTTWAKLKTLQDGRGNTTTFTYNGSTGNLLTIQRPMVGGSTPTVTMTWNSRGQMLTSTDETGIVTQFNYDASTEKLTSTVVDYGISPHLNLTTSFGYNTVGDTTSVTDPNTNQTTFQFDALRRMTQKTDPSPLSFVTKLTYDDNSNLTKQERQISGSPAWQTYAWTYSAGNERLTAVDPFGRTTTWTFDGKDRMQTMTDAQGRVWQYSYDALDRIYQVTDPTSTVCDTRTYTNNSKLASVKDARNNTTQYTWDGFDRANKTIYADTTFEQNSSYDANGNVLTYLTRSGNSIVNTFDVLNRLSTKAPQGQPTVTNTYDLAGRLTQSSKPVVAGDPSSGALKFYFDTAGRFYKEEYPDGKTVVHVLDANGNRTKTTWPDSYFVDRVFDQINRLTDIKLNGSGSSAAHFDYNELSQRTQLTYSNGATVVYNQLLNGDITGITHNFVGSNVNFAYGFNNVHEPVSNSVSDGTYVWHPSGSSSTTYGTADNVNKYPTVGGVGYSYDGNKNLTGDGTWTFGFDTENHLLSAIKTGVSASFVYDPLHRQSQKTVGSTKSRYVYSGWQRIADYDGTTGALQNRYIYGTGFDEPLITVSSGGTLTFLHQDRLGSIVATSDNTGAVTNKNLYSPFGQITTLAGTFGFTGQRYDSETGLYYYKRRYYAPALGRFLQPDPVGYTEDYNLYTYVGNSPLGFYDPMGLQKCEKQWGNNPGGNNKWKGDKNGGNGQWGGDKNGAGKGQWTGQTSQEDQHAIALKKWWDSLDPMTQSAAKLLLAALGIYIITESALAWVAARLGGPAGAIPAGGGTPPAGGGGGGGGAGGKLPAGYKPGYDTPRPNEYGPEPYVDGGTPYTPWNPPATPEPGPWPSGQPVGNGKFWPFK